MKKIIRIIKAVWKVAKCREYISFQLKKDGHVTSLVTYEADKVWSNAELLRMKRNGYEISDVVEL